MTTKFNPFGKEQSAKSAIDLLVESFAIGVRDYDRGASVWDEDRVTKDGKNEPGWVPQPELSRECVIEFSVNEGKGTGRQCIPASEFPEYVDALQNIIDTDYQTPPGADRTVYVPTYEHVGESFKMVRPKISVTQSDGTTRSIVDQSADTNVVSVRCTGGKGAKPMLVPRDEFPAVVAALRGVCEDLPQHVRTAMANFESQGTTLSDPSDD